MTYSASHIVLRAIGVFPSAASPLDEWSSGFRLAPTSGLTAPNDDLTTFLESVSSAYSTFHSGAGNLPGNTTILTKLTAARVGIDGKYNPPGKLTTERPFPTPVAGNGTPVGPWSTAIVCSLRTAVSRGLASNGRAYWPGCGFSVDGTTGRMDGTVLNTLSTRWQTLINAINTAGASLSIPCKVAVMSQGGLSGGPTHQLVTSVRLDGRFDAQERREDNTPSTYVSKTIS